MCSKPKSCSICLKYDPKLISTSETDSDNVKWSYKLTFCVPEVEWDEDCFMCLVCTKQLDAACSFRNLCLQSNGSHVDLPNWHCRKTSNKTDQEAKKNLTNDKPERDCKPKIDFTCYVCSKTFLTKPNLIKHIQLHLINRCDLCDEQFTTNTQLQLHKVQAHSETREDAPSGCRFCGRSFKSRTSLNQHIRRMHRLRESSNSDSIYPTPDNKINDNIEIIYPTPDNKINDDIEIVNVNNSLKIEDCADLKGENYCSVLEDEKFKLLDDNSYDNDFDNDNNECFAPEDANLNPTSEQNLTLTALEHPPPDFVAESGQKLKNETKSRTKTRSRAKFFCEECKNVFMSSKKLLNHALSVHGFDPSVIKPFGCDKCDSKFSSSSNLLQHKKYHVGKRTHICTFCGKGYITKSDLNTHEKQHLNKREYQCMGCPKTFNTNKDLRSHRLVVHTDPSLWNYVCTFCQKRFPIKSNLDQHMRRHTGEKRFGCHICEKRFVDKVVMQKHIKSHSNFRAFKCEHCEKEYKDCKVLEIHLTKVHGIGNAKIPVRVKKYFCHVCPKSYFAKNKLTRHMFSHTGEKPYVCHICDRKFTDKSYVKQHLKTTHNVFDVDENK